MSRLDIFIDRMVSQRACLDHGIAETAHMKGPVYELGLGNGRTFHHMREKIEGREIFVFERAIASHPDSTPDEAHAILGEITETLPARLAAAGPVASLIHADLGGHNAAKNVEFAKLMSPLIAPHLAPGGLVISSDRMFFEDLEEMPIPEGAVPGRCFIYRR